MTNTRFDHEIFPRCNQHIVFVTASTAITTRNFRYATRRTLCYIGIPQNFEQYSLRNFYAVTGLTQTHQRTANVNYTVHGTTVSVDESIANVCLSSIYVTHSVRSPPTLAPSCAPTLLPLANGLHASVVGQQHTKLKATE